MKPDLTLEEVGANASFNMRMVSDTNEQWYYLIRVGIVGEYNVGMSVSCIEEPVEGKELVAIPGCDGFVHGMSIKTLITDSVNETLPTNDYRIVGDPVMTKQAKHLFKHWYKIVQQDLTRKADSHYSSEYHIRTKPIADMLTDADLLDLFTDVTRVEGEALAYLNYMTHSTH